MRILPKSKRELIEASIGKRECDLIITNCKMVNVLTGEIYEAEVGVYDGFIAHVECDPDNTNRPSRKLEGKITYDAKGKYLIPGLIDAHIHIESTLMTPRNFAKAVLPHGTTTVITDPHEIANVYGVRGVEYMHENSENLPMRQFVLAPSCVPAVVGLENGGAEFLTDEIERLLNLDRVIGLGEVMDFIGVIENDDRMMDILELVEKKDMFIQGHAPYVSGRMLSAYLCGGANTCHETRTGQEARDKMRNGMYVDARQSSIAKDVDAIVKGVKDFKFLSQLTICTDDREADEILTHGHINDVIKYAVESGLDPIDAIRCSTLNNAREIGIQNLGAIAPSFVADMLVVEDLKDFKVNAVFYDGKLVAENGQLTVEIEDREFELEQENSVKIKDLKLEDFILKAPIENGVAKVNVLKYSTKAGIETSLSTEEVKIVDGQVDLSQDKDLQFVAVINRHGKVDTKTVALVRNFGIDKGAVGSTVSHDCHNLVVVYNDPKEALLVAQDIVNIRGGFSCALDGKIRENLQLEVAGLISTKEAKELAIQSDKMKEALREIGITEIHNPLLRIVTLALPVIPEARMSDLGLVDVLGKKIVPVFE